VSGYVRIHRSLIGHPAFRNDAEAMAFAWLVARAAWKSARVRYKERAITLERGQLAISVRDFAAAMDRDKAWIERLLKRLKAETMVETRHETGVNVITICNYGQYQGDPVLCETPRETANETRARQAQDTEQVREKGKKISSEPKGSSPRGPKFSAPVGVPDQTWSDFLLSPKRRKAGMSDTAYAGICNNLAELAEHGFPPGPMIALAVERGWATVKLEWVLNERDRDEQRANTLGRHQPTDGLSSTARAGLAVFGH
jgi:DNA-binding transcriptional regulator YhcF (GntR family)